MAQKSIACIKVTMGSSSLDAERAPAPLLILTCGNPSRGDDALGSEVYRWVQEQKRSPEWQQVEALTDFQLQVEHVLDMKGRERVLFVDASVGVSVGAALTQVTAVEDSSYSSHALSPAALLHSYERVFNASPPPSEQLAIGGYDYELGCPLSAKAMENLEQAKRVIVAWREKYSGK